MKFWSSLSIDTIFSSSSSCKRWIWNISSSVWLFVFIIVIVVIVVAEWKKNTMWLSCCVYSCDVIVLDSAIDPSIHSEAIGFQYNQFISFLSKIILFIENSFSHSYYFYFVSIIKFIFCTPLNVEKNCSFHQHYQQILKASFIFSHHHRSIDPLFSIHWFNFEMRKLLKFLKDKFFYFEKKKEKNLQRQSIITKLNNQWWPMSWLFEIK